MKAYKMPIITAQRRQLDACLQQAASSLPVTSKPIDELSAADLQPYGVFLTGIPELVPPIDDNLWTVVNAITYVAADGTVIHIPAGRKTDLASTPNLAKAVFGGPGRETVAAVVHDEGYKDPDKVWFNILIQGFVKQPKSFWDDCFWRLMKATKTEAVKRSCYFVAVKYFGWFVWLKHKYCR